MPFTGYAASRALQAFFIAIRFGSILGGQPLVDPSAKTWLQPETQSGEMEDSLSVEMEDEIISFLQETKNLP